MDITSIMMNSMMMPLSNTQTAIPQNSQMGAGGELFSSGPGFVDLLGLAEEVQIAEEQGGLMGLELQIEGDALKQVDLSAIQGASLLANPLEIRESIQNQETEIVGQKVLGKSPELFETSASLEMKDLMLTQSAPTPKANLERVDSQSVLQWSAALASGDLKSVVVESEPQKPETTKQSILGKSSTEFLSEASAKTKSLSAEPKESVDSFQAFRVQDLPRVETSKATESSVAPTDKAQELVLEKPKSQGQDSSQSAQDFLFQREANLGSASVVASKDVVFSGAEEIKLSPSTMDHVAEKIENLKAAGGGTLSVDLGNSELGALKIKVTKVAGAMRVEIKADRPETRQMLENSKAELVKHLETKVGDSQVKINNESFASLTTSKTAVAHVASSSLSTEQLFDFRSVAGSEKSVQTNHLGVSSLEANRSTESAKDGEAWQRDERREQARSQWQDFMKKSA